MDPAARRTGADGGAAYCAYSTNYLVDLDNAVIVDIEPTAPIRPAEARAARDMIDRVKARFGIKPGKLVGDIVYGSAEMLGWLVEDRKIAPHIPVWDKSKRTDGTFSREEFAYDATADRYTCLAGNTLETSRRKFSKPRPTNVSKTDAYMTSFRQKRKVEMLFAHLKRYIGLRMIRLRGPKGATEQFQLAATAQNLRKLAKLVPQPDPA
ncbi:transposase [Roseinatronobacter alkalisoli]|uniref:Transposase n=1 Tax=Roseinatronobacter alkalisoli TaxID=3028235 RepID=A0ABT5TE50_9RHOB|nr:transposase [Roseinatronobacter sp. HJB301]MDD7973408.1 transposase [Roseinatronobacter sp. HJB301]